jgi:hypothetical protein
MVAVEGAIVEPLGLQKDDRIVGLDGADQKALGVIGRGRNHRGQAGHVGEQGLGALAVGLAAEDAAAIGRAHGDRRREVAG